MVDLASFERLGDIESTFELTRAHRRLQQHRERFAESLRCDVTALTWERFRAGAPCPGCGRPYIDDEPWHSPGLMHMSDEERARYDAEVVTYNERHGECHSARHSISGSLTMHCMKCCPPPPLSQTQLERISAILGRRRPPYELMVWRLRLYCGHVVEKQAHSSHKNVAAAFSGHVSCPQCGLDPATIVDAVAVGLVEDPPGTAVADQPSPPRPTRAQLEKRIAELEDELRTLCER